MRCQMKCSRLTMLWVVWNIEIGLPPDRTRAHPGLAEVNAWTAGRRWAGA